MTRCTEKERIFAKTALSPHIYSTMQFSLFIVLVSLTLASGFRFAAVPLARRGLVQSRLLSTEPDAPEPNTPKGVELVPLDKTNIENAAAVTGGILGFVLGGPVLGAVFAAVTNFVSKKDGESGEALRGVGKTVIESYNFLNKINTKYSVTNQVGETVSKAVGSVETDSDILDKVKSTYATATSKFTELNKEYDLISKGKEAVVAASTLSDAAIEKTIELNAKVGFMGFMGVARMHEVGVKNIRTYEHMSIWCCTYVACTKSRRAHVTPSPNSIPPYFPCP